MQVLIIEDEKPAAERLKKLASPLLKTAHFHPYVDSISSAVNWLQTNRTPDLIFCDIQLADGHSFDIFEQVKVNSPIIFTTAFDQYAIKAFKLNSIDYLLKPIDPLELAAAIDKFEAQKLKHTIDIEKLKAMLAPKSNYKERFIVKIGEKIHSIPTNEIVFFFSEEKATFLQTIAARKYIIDYSLEQLEQLLDPNKYYRINRKFISSFEAIDSIVAYSNSRLKISLRQCDEKEILISREKVADFKAWLDR